MTRISNGVFDIIGVESDLPRIRRIDKGMFTKGESGRNLNRIT